MSAWNIWAEATHLGDHLTATKLNKSPIEAETLDAAVLQHIASLPAHSEEPSHFHRENEGYWTLWGHRLHPQDPGAGIIASMDERVEVESEAYRTIGAEDPAEYDIDPRLRAMQ